MSAITIATIDRKIARLTDQKDAAIAQMLSDYEWMDTPVTVLEHFNVEGKATRDTATHFHILETVWFDEQHAGRAPDLKAHDAEHCIMNGHWCRKVGETRRPVGRNNIGFKFHGTYKVVARHNEKLYLVSDH